MVLVPHGELPLSSWRLQTRWQDEAVVLHLTSGTLVQGHDCPQLVMLGEIQYEAILLQQGYGCDLHALAVVGDQCWAVRRADIWGKVHGFVQLVCRHAHTIVFKAQGVTLRQTDLDPSDPSSQRCRAALICGTDLELDPEIGCVQPPFHGSWTVDQLSDGVDHPAIRASTGLPAPPPDDACIQGLIAVAPRDGR